MSARENKTFRNFITHTLRENFSIIFPNNSDNISFFKNSITSIFSSTRNAKKSKKNHKNAPKNFFHIHIVGKFIKSKVDF